MAKKYAIQFRNEQGHLITTSGDMEKVKKYQGYADFKAGPFSTEYVKQLLSGVKAPTSTPSTPTTPTTPTTPSTPVPVTPTTPTTPQQPATDWSNLENKYFTQAKQEGWTWLWIKSGQGEKKWYRKEGEQYIQKGSETEAKAKYVAQVAAPIAPTAPTTPAQPAQPVQPPTQAPTLPQQQPQLTEVGRFPKSSNELDQWKSMGYVFKDGKWWKPSGAVVSPGAPTTPGQPQQPQQPQFGEIPADQLGQVYQPETGAYTIQQGDTLSAIAQKHGTTVQALMAANPNIKDPNMIYAGATLNISGDGTTTTVQPTAPVVSTTTEPTDEEIRAQIEETLTALHDKYTEAGVSDADATKLVEARGTITPSDLGYDPEDIANITRIGGVGGDDSTFDATDLSTTTKLSGILPDLAGVGTSAGNLNVSSGVAGIIALLDSTSAEDTEYADINAKINTLLSDIEADKDDFEAILAEYKIPEIQEQLDELNLDIARIKGEISAFDAETETGYAGIVSQAIPQGLLVGQAAQYQRQREAGRASKAADLASNAALQQAYIQNLTIATGLADASINFKWQGITNTLTALQTQLTLAKDVMDRADAKQLNIISILIQDQMDQVNKQKTKESEMNGILITAAINGAPLSLINSAKASNDSIAAASMLSNYLKAAAKAPEAAKTIKIDGIDYQWNPATGQYDIPVEAAVVAVREEEIRGFDTGIKLVEEQLVIIERILANTKGLQAAVSPHKYIRWTWAAKQSGDFQAFTADVDTLASRDVLDTLVDLKSRGGTLGALSEKELKMLEDASSNFGSWRKTKTDKQGNIETVRYNIDPAEFTARMLDLKEELTKYVSDAKTQRGSAQTSMEIDFGTGFYE